VPAVIARRARGQAYMHVYVVMDHPLSVPFGVEIGPDTRATGDKGVAGPSAGFAWG
jgi:hypothetical protein